MISRQKRLGRIQNEVMLSEPGLACRKEQDAAHCRFNFSFLGIVNAGRKLFRCKTASHSNLFAQTWGRSSELQICPEHNSKLQGARNRWFVSRTKTLSACTVDQLGQGFFFLCRWFHARPEAEMSGKVGSSSWEKGRQSTIANRES